jgi:hypothetical protein
LADGLGLIHQRQAQDLTPLPPLLSSSSDRRGGRG